MCLCQLVGPALQQFERHDSVNLKAFGSPNPSHKAHWHVRVTGCTTLRCSSHYYMPQLSMPSGSSFKFVHHRHFSAGPNDLTGTVPATVSTLVKLRLVAPRLYASAGHCSWHEPCHSNVRTAYAICRTFTINSNLLTGTILSYVIPSMTSLEYEPDSVVSCWLLWG